MAPGIRRVVQRFADAPTGDFNLPWGRQGHFAHTGSVQRTDRVRAGPASRRFSRTITSEAAADNGSDGEAAACEPIQRIINSRRLKTEEVNKRLQEQWDGCFNDNVFRYTCHEGKREQQNAALQAKLAEDFISAAKASMPLCPNCSCAHSAHGFQTLQCASSEQLTYVAIEGRIPVSHPVFQCALCGDRRSAHPVSFGCFPATPTEPQVIYNGSLLHLTCKVSLAGPLAMDAWCHALEAQHQNNGCAKDAVPCGTGASNGEKVWRNLGMAAQQWQRVAESAQSLERYNVTHIAAETQHQNDSENEDAEGIGAFSGPTRQCPCCWRTCQAAMADACLGITHLRAAGRAADSIHPLQRQSPFVDDAVIKELLMERRNVDPAALERPECSEFVAASKGFSERQQRQHIQGVAAAVCRHEFTLVAVNLFTHENFVYYELILERLLRMYDQEKGRKLICFFLDIMCQFDTYWKRLHPELLDCTPGMAIGPWHVKAHVPQCQQKLGARLLEGAGCSFGDNIEHLWVDLRKPAHLIKRMTKAARQDRLTLLMEERQRLKELRLPKMLMTWAVRAVRRAADLQSSISSLEAEIAELQECDDSGPQPSAGTGDPGSQRGPDLRAPNTSHAAGSSAGIADAARAWQHRYHALLEEYYAMQYSACSVQPAAGRHTVGSLPQQRRQQQLAAVERQLQDIEARRQIDARWPADSREYREVGQERKVLEIQRCEAGLHSLFVQYHALQRELRHNPYRERHQGVHIRKRMSAVSAKAKTLVEELRSWHTAPGTYDRADYDMASLDASRLLLADVLPWQRENLSASLATLKRGELAELVARRERCCEEVQIVRREATDMVEFYLYYESQVAQQLSILQNADVYSVGVPSEYHADAAAAAFCDGATAILTRKLQHIETMREAASMLVGQLRQHVLDPAAFASHDATALEPAIAGMEVDELEDEFFDGDSDSFSESSMEDDAEADMMF